MGKMDQIDIHNRERGKASALRKLYESDICQGNKDLILEFIEYKTEEDSIGILRQNKYLSKLRILAEYLGKSFDKATKDDIKKITHDLDSEVARGMETL